MQSRLWTGGCWQAQLGLVECYGGVLVLTILLQIVEEEPRMSKRWSQHQRSDEIYAIGYMSQMP